MRKTESKNTKQNAFENYSQLLESYYGALLHEERAGRIDAETHTALDTFLCELRELVAEVQAPALSKAA